MSHVSGGATICEPNWGSVESPNLVQFLFSLVSEEEHRQAAYVPQVSGGATISEPNWGSAESPSRVQLISRLSEATQPKRARVKVSDFLSSNELADADLVGLWSKATDSEGDGEQRLDFGRQ